MGIYSIIFDIIILLVIIITAVGYGKKGFMACVLSFIGTLAALLVSIGVANWVSPMIFDGMFKTGIEEKVMQTLTVDGVETVNDLLATMFGFLPSEIIEGLSGAMGDTIISATPEMARNIVETVIQPIVVPMISFVVFVILFMILRIVLAILGKMLRGVNKIPVLGAGNKVLGFVAGVCIGLLYAYILLCVVWGVQALYGGEWIQQIANYSVFAKIATSLNPFLIKP